MAAEVGTPVVLFIYDLSRGLASVLSPSILGRQIEGVWHTSVVVFGREYFFGGGGITTCDPGTTALGAPLQTQPLGETFVPPQLFADYVHGLATTTYTPSSYNLLEHNCNNFSDEVAQFLCGGRVPKHILALPEEALGGPARAALATLLAGLAPQGAAPAAGGGGGGGGGGARRGDSPDYTTLNDQIELARQESAALAARRSGLADKLARRERRRDKKRRKEALRSGAPPDDEDMAEALSVSEAAPAPARPAPAGPAPAGPAPAGPAPDDDDRPKRPREPPILFNDMDGDAEFTSLTKALEGFQLSEEETISLDELRQYLVLREGSWVLGDGFLDFVGRLLQDAAAPPAGRVALLRCLAASAGRDDVSLLLHGDRRQHALLNYACDVDALPPPEQEALALFMCNLFEQVPSAEWLLYISEWEAAGRARSNIRATTKVCVTCLLSPAEALRELGTALLYNIATKEVKTVVFDDVSVELCMAALQVLGAAPPPREPWLWRCMAALASLVAHGGDVPQLVRLVGPSPADYRGTSPRVDEKIDLIMQKLDK